MRILLLIALVGLAALGPSAAHAADRIALVIGNSGYKVSPLANPKNDAALVADALADTGFAVVRLIDADERTMKTAIRKFKDDVTAAGERATALFYYAGHGVQANGRNYLIPVGADIQSTSDMEYEAIEAQWVLDLIGESRAGVSIVILDACRNNPYEVGSRSASRGLARMDPPRGAFLAYSTAPGQVAQDGDGRNSPFSQALATEMRRPGLKIEDVFKRVRRNVLEATADKQVPWETSSLVGDFYFAGRGVAGAPAPQPPVESPPTARLDPTPRAPARGGRGDGPSFDCGKASTVVEKFVCERDDLAGIDGEMGRAYKGARAKLSSGDQSVLRRQQLDWLKLRDASCVGGLSSEQVRRDANGVADCLYSMMRNRIRFLENY